MGRESEGPSSGRHPLVAIANEGDDAIELRAVVSRGVAGEPPRKGGILAALRRSPLVGAELDLARPRETGRKIDL